MNRYEKRNAAYRIDGCYDLRSHEAALGKNRDAFERAKAETLGHMREALMQTEALTFDEFFAERKNSPHGAIARAMHYPECGDTAAYPTLTLALEEIYAWFKCSNGDCGRKALSA